MLLTEIVILRLCRGTSTFSVLPCVICSLLLVLFYWSMMIFDNSERNESKRELCHAQPEEGDLGRQDEYTVGLICAEVIVTL